ncbi:MAG TPA: hypothetical protein DCX46_00220 [Bacteroidetes bacterium]|nr:hypothetical protein [Bacteroidota bacterium]
MNKQLLLLVGIILLSMNLMLAQSTAGEGATVEPTGLIDKPTAGMLGRGNYAVSGSFFQRGGVLFGVSVGLLNQFSFGISYGGTDLLGSSKPEMNPYPGVNVKVRVVEETTTFPAIAIGFDSQGREVYLDSLKRYGIKSPGFYAVASQNYAMMGNLSLHGGVNYCLEREDGDKDINFFFGAEKSLGKQFSLLLEYDLATNDNSADVLGRGRGYLNFGLRWSWGKGMVVGFDLKDVAKNRQNISVGNRTLYFEFIGSF